MRGRTRSSRRSRRDGCPRCSRRGSAGTTRSSSATRSSRRSSCRTSPVAREDANEVGQALLTICKEPLAGRARRRSRTSPPPPASPSSGSTSASSIAPRRSAGRSTERRCAVPAALVPRPATLPRPLVDVLRRLGDAGHRSWIVGGRGPRPAPPPPARGERLRRRDARDAARGDGALPEGRPDGRRARHRHGASRAASRSR